MEPTSMSAGFRIWRVTPGPMDTDHSHTDIEVNYLERGCIRYLIGGSLRSFRAGELVAFWAAQPHRTLACDPGTTGIWATVPLAWFLGQDCARTLVAALLGGPLADSRPEDAALFAAWLAAWDRPSPVGERIVRLELEARLLRLAPEVRPGVLPSAHAGDAQPVLDAGDAMVATMTGVMARDYQAPLSLADIAAPTGFHPRYAATRFRQKLGVAPWEYLLRLRVAAAQRLLLATDDDVLAVAYACGFGSPTRFYPTFKRITGMTPAEYRAQRGRIGKVQTPL